MKKRALNRKRKRACPNQNDSTPLQQPAQPNETSSTKDDTLIAYMTNLIELLEHRRVTREEVVEFIKEVRQRGIDSFDFSRYIEKKEKRPPP